MNLKVGFRSTRRQWLRAVIYILFLAVLSFGFLSHILEYQMMQQQVEQAAAYYRPVGRVRLQNPQEWYVTDGVKLIDDSDYIMYSNRHYFLFATLQEGYTPRLETYVGNELYGNNRCYFTGTLLSKNHVEFEEPETIRYGTFTTYTDAYTLMVQVDSIESALPEYIEEGDTIRVQLYTNGEESLEQMVDEMETGEAYLFKTQAGLVGRSKVGSENYTFHLRPEDPVMMFCQPDFSDVSEEEQALIEKDILRQQTNIRAITVNSISDARLSEVIDSTFFLVDGRWVTHEDEEENRMVCVIHQDLAEKSGYAIGDTLELNLYRAEVATFSGYLTNIQVDQEVYENWMELETLSRSYEIIGICSDHMNGYDNASIFVPPTTIPQEWLDQWWEENTINENYYYFVLESPTLIQPFLEEYETELAEMGCYVSFRDNGWDKFWESAEPMLQSTLTAAMFFGALMCCSMILLAVLAVLSRRREMAVMRALGVIRGHTVLNCFLPLLFLGILGIAAGAGISWYYTSQKATELLSGLISLLGSEAGLQLPVWYLILIAGILVLIWSVILLALIWLQLRKPVLAQLQGGSQNATKKKTSVHREMETAVSHNSITADVTLTSNRDHQTDSIVPAQSTGQESVRAENDGMISLITRLFLRYATRTPGRSSLAILITCGFLIILSAMAYFIQYNERRIDYLYQSVEVGGSIIQKGSAVWVNDGGVVPLSVVEALQEDEDIRDLYLEMGTFLYLVKVKKTSEGTELAYNRDIVDVRGLSTWVGSTVQEAGVQIEYLPGYDETFLTSRDPWANSWIVLDSAFMDQYDIDLGDRIVGWYGNEKLCAYLQYTVIGRMYDLQDKVAVDMLVRSKELEIQCMKKDRIKLYYSTVDFTLRRSKNPEIASFQEELDELLSAPESKGRAELMYALDDEELTMAVEPLEQGNRLMEILYPILLAVSVLVSAGVAVLLMLPRRKEAAIMRVLGTRKRHAMTVFVGGHMLAYLLGILVALIGIWWVAPWLYKWVWSSMLLCIALSLAGSLAGSLIGAWTLVSGKPLELLQVKE